MKTTIGDIGASPTDNFSLADYGFVADATPYGYRGGMHGSSSPTYKGAVDAMEGNVWFNIGGIAGNALIGGVGFYSFGLHGFLHDTTARKQLSQTLLATEIYRSYYVISEMKKVYKENCEECEK
jgi:hypothetical protein